jgi:tRNA(Met) C34 N-acetyltransferase TmcA
MLGWSVSEKMFSEEQLEQLRSSPQITRDELIKFFTLTSADLAFVDPGRGRGPADRLGLAVQLASLPWLGFVPDEVASAPAAAVARVAEQLGLDPRVLQGVWKAGAYPYGSSGSGGEVLGMEERGGR